MRPCEACAGGIDGGCGSPFQPRVTVSAKFGEGDNGGDRGEGEEGALVKEDDGEVLNGWGLLLSDPLLVKIVALVALVVVGCGRGCGCG